MRLLLLATCAALLLPACGGDPDVEQLRATLAGEVPPSATWVERAALNRAFARQVVRAAGLRRELHDALPGTEAEWAPLAEPAADRLAAPDVSAWVRDGTIDATGLFQPEPRRTNVSIAELPGTPPGDDDAALALAAALAEVWPKLRRLEWDPELKIAALLAPEGDTARVNPTLLQVLVIAAPVATQTDAVELAALGSAAAPPAPARTGFHETLDTGCSCLDTALLVALAPFWIITHAIEAFAAVLRLLASCGGA
ncbi:MAG: hypothetical protein ACK4N5_00920 [Myxococcales bacterium]